MSASDAMLRILDAEAKGCRVCRLCGEIVAPQCPCPQCVARWPARKLAERMTPQERAEELERLGGVLEWPFAMFHKRVEELVGRPVWTHELGLNWEGFIREAAGLSSAPTMADIVELIPEEKRIVVVLPDPDANEPPDGIDCELPTEPPEGES